MREIYKQRKKLNQKQQWQNHFVDTVARVLKDLEHQSKIVRNIIAK